MTTTATIALRLAQQVIDALAASDIDQQGIEIDGQIHTADEIRSVLRRGLESLRQGPLMLDALPKAAKGAGWPHVVYAPRWRRGKDEGGEIRAPAAGLGWAVSYTD